jgi:hypothetical protein
MTRLSQRVRSLEYKLAPPVVAHSWSDCFDRVDGLAQGQLSPAERSLLHQAFGIRNERGEDAFNDQHREVWTRWNDAFVSVQSGLHLPYAMEAADRWL